jgi:hypothetical protein
MDNDSGRGSRSDQPPPRAAVRSLHLNEVAPDAGAVEDDWYETERLTGQITGRARGAAATEGAAAPVPSPALDWRHADPEPEPSGAQRLRRGLERQRGPRAALRLPSAERWLRRHRRATDTPAPASQPSEVPALAAPEAVAPRNDPARPLLGFRQRSEHQEPESGRALGVRIREQMPRLAWQRRPSVVAVTVVAAVGTIGIAAALNGSPPKAHQATVVAGSAGQASDFAAVTKALSAAVGLIGHQLRGGARPHHSVRGRHANRASQRPSRRAQRHSAKRRTVAPAATPTPASTASSSGSSTTSSTSQSGTSQTASTASTQHSQPTRPAFGQNGVLGPGRGAPGTQ